jgi:hypothetical protein
MGNTPSDISIGDYFIGTRHEVVGSHKKLKIFITKGGRLISERIVTGGGNVGSKMRNVSYKLEEVLERQLDFCDGKSLNFNSIADN